MSIEQRYWDSSAFLAWLSDEPKRAAMCEPVLVAAAEGKIRLITSAITLTEVIKLRGQVRLPATSEQKILDFFEQPYILVRDVDRFVAEDARGLIWKHNVSPKDSIHLATALAFRLGVMDTFDDGLIKLSEKLGSPPLFVRKPHAPYQPEIDYGPDHRKPSKP